MNDVSASVPARSDDDLASAIPGAVRAMVDAAVDATSIVDRDLRVLYFNQAYVRLAGLRVRNLRGGRARAMCHEHFGLSVCDGGCIAHRAFQTKRHHRIDEVVSRHLPLRLIVVAVPLIDDDGEVYAVLEQYRDVTAESRLQVEYRRLLASEREEKRRLAADAAAKLAQRNRELEDINTRLEAASAAKSRFLASMSHEIRTPLSGVLGMAQLLAQTDLDEEQANFVSTLCDAGDTLQALINNVLDISKIEAGRMELEHIGFSLREVIEGATFIFAPTAQTKDLAFHVQIDADVDDRFRGDPTRIRQVVANLCNNAVKFTQEGHVRVHVSGSGRHITIAVHDTGVGISTTQQQRLFEVFSQMDEATHRRFGGTGLGLAITRQLVMLMGGDISVDSVEDEGSVFRVSLPLQRDHLRQGDGELDASSLRIDVVGPADLARDALVQALGWWNVSVVEHDRLHTVPVARAQDGPSLRAVVFTLPLAAAERPILERLRSEPELSLVGLVPMGRLATHRMDELDGHMVSPVRPSHVQDLVERLTRQASRDAGAEPAVDRRIERAKRTILIAEDNDTNRRILERVLSGAGYSFVSSANGEEAFEAYRAHDIDLVLMDCQMPVMDGFEATRRIRRHEKYDGRVPVPIIALTANATEDNRDQCLEVGMDRQMTKPYKIDAVIGALDEALLAVLA